MDQHDVIGRPFFWYHILLQQEAPELRYDNCSCAKKLAEGLILCQQQPNALAAPILDVLANEDKILWQKLCFMPAFVAVHVGMIEVERAAEGSYHNEDVNCRGVVHPPGQGLEVHVGSNQGTNCWQHQKNRWG